jgi:undecaprenyl-diphosphatase
MNLFQAIVIGIIQGLTEFIPVSSNAHIRIIPALLGWNDPGAAFTAVIQWGTLVAVIIYFRHEIGRLTKAVFDDLFFQRFCRTADAKLAWMIALGTIPIVVVGLTFKKFIKSELRSLYVIAAAAIVMALILWAAEWYTRRGQQSGQRARDLGDLSWWDAFIVGCWQAVAVIPGASRSGVTITGGLFSGLTRETAARFSFLLSLPSVFAAGLLELYEERHELFASTETTVALVVATVVSGFVGYASISFLLNYLKKHTTYVFIFYRIALGIVLLLLLMTHVIDPLAGAVEVKPGRHAPAKSVQKPAEESDKAP